MVSYLAIALLAQTAFGRVFANQTVGKRGLPYNNDNPSKDAVYANLFTGFPKVTWAYDWGYPSWNLDKSFEFVPMLWGIPNNNDNAGWPAAVQASGTKNILAFNEPDLTYSASSNILPEVAAEAYKAHLQPFAGTVRLGSPSILWNNIGSSSGGDYNSATWTEYFMGNCTGCTVDFFAMHYYQDCITPTGESGAIWFKANVTNAHETMQKPIWITEFECYGSEEEQIGFLEEVLPWMDGLAYVERYAYFGAFPEYLINAAGDGLSALGKAFATI